MYAILKFNLDNVDDLYSHKQALKGKDLALTLWAICEFIRVELKHGNLNEDKHAQMSKVQDRVFEELRSHGIDLDDLIY